MNSQIIFHIIFPKKQCRFKMFIPKIKIFKSYLNSNLYSKFKWKYVENFKKILGIRTGQNIRYILPLKIPSNLIAKYNFKDNIINLSHVNRKE